MHFKDYFSTQATTYARARPRYPPELFAWLADHVPEHQLAWDAGCGNGQAALGLATYFAHVVASDPSAAQIAHAEMHPRVAYRVEAAETPSLPVASVDLVTVAQALHWFDLDRFHAAVARVLKPGGLIAEWTYAVSTVNLDIDRIFVRLHDGLLGDCWPPERRHVETSYNGLPFPFARIETPTFTMRARWTLPQYLDYLRSWSASQRYLQRHGEDAVGLLTAEFESAWGDLNKVRDICWPLSLRVGRVPR